MSGIDPTRLPGHIAIIMDGNGRWAERHGMGRIMGHRKGATAVRATVRACRRLGIRYLTLYAFSMENWLRPKAEVRALLKLLREYLDGEIQEMMDNDIALKVLGDLDLIEEPLRLSLLERVKQTAGNRGMVVSLALSYGGRDEIVAAARKMIGEALAGRISPGDVSKEYLARQLYTADIPDPDLLIRTGGERRISNFLLWQMAYTEFYFTDTLWPDFGEPHLREAIEDFQRRERRFGQTSEQRQGN
jgi:undecaprenyl diphosphate synthase